MLRLIQENRFLSVEEDLYLWFFMVFKAGPAKKEKYCVSCLRHRAIWRMPLETRGHPRSQRTLHAEVTSSRFQL